MSVKKEGYSEDFHYFTSSIVAIATTYSFVQFFHSALQAYESKKLLKTIKKSAIKTPEDSFREGEKCIIKGTVDVNSKVVEKKIEAEGENKKKSEYVLHLRFLESMYSNETFDTNKKDYIIDLKEIALNSDIRFHESFFLKLNKAKVHVRSYDQINYGPALEINKWENKRRSLNLTEKLHVLMLAYLRGIGTLVINNEQRPTFLRGIEIGTRQIEAGIKVGSSIMALGSIAATTEGNVVFQPNVFFKERLSFVMSLNEVIRVLEEKRNIWGLLFLLGSLYLGRRAYKYHKKHNLKQLVRNLLGWK